MPVITAFQVRRGTAAQWASVNPILLAGEQGLETDTNKVKFGDGTTAWNGLAYAISGGTGVSAFVNLTDATTAPIASTNSSVSAALAAKAPTVSPTFTGTVSGVTKAHVGLSNVDNTSDANKPISTAQAAVNTATTASLAGKQAALTAGSNITIVGSTISSSADTAISATFGQSIPFDANRTMPETAVSGALAFTINTSNAKDDAQTAVSLVADGSHLPDFSAFILAGTQGYDNTNGRVNNVIFFRSFGRYYYGVFLGPVADVIPPSLVSATVANASPTHVDLVWSEPINSAIPAASSFTVSGHTVTAHTYVDSTHTYLTVSAAFVNGEAARTLDYAVPGTNPIKDLAVIPNLGLAITGRAITNNVAVGGSLSLASPAIGTSLNLDTFSDWVWQRQAAGVALQKVGQPFIVTNINATGLGSSDGTVTWPANPAAPSLSCTTSVNSGTGASVGAFGPSGDHDNYFVNSGTPSVAFSMPAGTTPQTVRVHWGAVKDSGFSITGAGQFFTATLSDGSAGPLTVNATTPTIDASGLLIRSDITFSAGSNGQTLTLNFNLGVVKVQLIALV